MPSLLPARWSTSDSKAVRVDAALFDAGDDCAIGFEAACPALQLEGWELPPASAHPQEQALN